MASTTSGWVVEKKGEAPVLKEYALQALGYEEVEVEMICSGLCHTDCHMSNNDWGITTFPMVAGHEGVGKVVSVGPAVTKLKGKWLGLAGFVIRAGVAETASKAKKGYAGTYVGGKTGTFGHKVRISQHFAYPIPEKLDPIKSAPLLCAGMTVYQPLRRYITYPGIPVGVVGIGGLGLIVNLLLGANLVGHMAIKFAHHMGAYVTVFSSSADKEKEAKAMGADRFVVCTDKQAMKDMQATQEFIIDTAPVSVNWEEYIGILTCGGVFCLVGVPVDRIPVPTMALVFGQKSIVGSIVSGSFVMCEMLDFCAKHQIYPDCEIWNFKDLPAAMERCLSGKARYRIVLKW